MKTLEDLLNQNEEEKEPIMSEMAAADYEQMQSPIIPNNTPQEQVFTTPKLEDVLPPKQQPEMDQTQQPQVPMVADASEEMAPKKPETEMERLERMLSEARKSDRTLKIGGAIGDALATYINARSQMKAKVPGVQVQQGAGLGKIAEMFQTAPEIESDVKTRREALLKQYAELARDQRAKARLDSAKEVAAERNKALLEAAGIRASGSESGKQYREEESKKRDERFIKKEILGLMDKVSKDFRYKDAYKESLSFDQVDKLMEAAKKGNEVAFNTVGTKMAKAMGEVGVLTESDVRRYVEGGSLTRKAGDSLLRMMNGKPSDATMQDISQITEVLKEAHQNKLQPVFDDYANRAVQLGLSEEEAYKRFKFPLPPHLKQQQKSNQTQQKSMSDNFEPRINNVLKANPGSTRKQVIDALKKDNKLPPDYE